MMKPLLFLGELFLLTVQQKETLIHSHNINQEAKRIKSNSLFCFIFEALLIQMTANTVRMINKSLIQLVIQSETDESRCLALSFPLRYLREKKIGIQDSHKAFCCHSAFTLKDTTSFEVNKFTLKTVCCNTISVITKEGISPLLSAIEVKISLGQFLYFFN